MTARRITAAFWIAALAAPLLASDYHLTLLVYIGMSAIVSLGLVVLTGQAGLSSFGQAAYVGIGAYVTAILTVRFGVSPWLTLPIAILTAGAGSFVGAQLTVRLSGHYLPLATIAFAVAMFYLFGALAITGGYSGIGNIPRLSIAGFDVRAAWQFYLIVLAALFLVMKAFSNLIDSRMGRAIRAIRSGIAMPEAMGVDTHSVKAGIFVVACTLAAIVGWFYAHFQQFINPTPFSLNEGVEYLFMTVIGGAQSLWGPVLGAGLLTLLKQLLQQVLPSLVGFSGNFEIVVFGVLVILLFQFSPDGLIPGAQRALGWGAIRPKPIEEAPELPTCPRAEAGDTILTVRNMSKSFGGVHANREIDLDLRAGEVLALIGPNGAGKSTLFDLISGLTRADRGSVHIRGTRVSGFSSRRIASAGLSRTFQHVRLVNAMSAVENVALGAHRRGSAGMIRAMFRLDREEESRIMADATRQLRRVRLADLAWSEADSLALGQQRILEIARALAADPQILLLDEPAAGLRAKEKDALAALLRALRGDGLGILLVEHDMQFVMGVSDRIAVLDYGRKIAEGAPDEIRADLRVLDAYLGAA